MRKINCDISVKITPKQSEIIQNYCFKNDFTWLSGKKFVQHYKADYLNISYENKSFGYTIERPCFFRNVMSFNQFYNAYIKSIKYNRKLKVIENEQ